MESVLSGFTTFGATGVKIKCSLYEDNLMKIYKDISHRAVLNDQSIDHDTV